MTDTDGDNEDGARPSPKPPPGKPSIRLDPGDLHRICDETEAVLAATGRYFHTGGVLVRIVANSRCLTVERINDQTLRKELSELIDWWRPDKAGIATRCDPPPSVVQALLHGQDRRSLRELIGIARQPFFRPDGSFVLEPGYDAETGMYAAFDPSSYSEATPSKGDAKAAVAYFRELLWEFVFPSVQDHIAAFCAILTAAVRPSLPVAPAFSITAAAPGSGKSYLAELLAAIAGPEEPFRVGFPTSADEAAKLIITACMEKPAVLLFDDMQGDWRAFSTLNAALTNPALSARLLGANRMVTVSTRLFVLGTGNNVAPERDMRRRVVTIRLDPKDESPALRSFEHDPVAAVKADRSEVLRHAFNIIRAFQDAGTPKTDVRPIGSYGEWSRLCREPLVWLGLPDPASSIMDQLEDDPQLEALSEFLQAWHDVFGSQSITVRQLVERAHSSLDGRLAQALEELPICEGRTINRGKLGWFVSKNQRRRVVGLRIEPGDKAERRSWRVVRD